MDIVTIIEDIFTYSVLQRGFAAGIMVAIVLPCIGMVVSLKRLSMIGDALSHTSLAGVALGLLLGFNPVAGAVAVCVVAALGIEAIRKYLSRFSEMAIAIIMSAGIGVAGILLSLLSVPANFNAYLFGSIMLMGQQDFKLIAALSAVVMVMFILLYRHLFYVAFDEQAAKLSGVKVRTVNFVFTVMTAITVAIASKTVGALVVSSIMVLPVACAMQFERGFKQTLFAACAFACLFTLTGQLAAYALRVTPSGAIVLIAIAAFLTITIIKSVGTKLFGRKNFTK